jgi:NitT/TauT family transport system ATP-binding protein
MAMTHHPLTRSSEDDMSQLDPETIVASLENVSVGFSTGVEHRQVLDDVSLSVSAGEFVVLVGKSGCGKTTILNLLAGLLHADSGRVSVLGSPPHKARSRIGYMFARDALIPWRTALRNVEYPLEIRGVRRSERGAQASAYLDLVHMSHARKLWPWQLSQGMRQRVALARTWVTDPDVLLMDEPFAALDAQTRLAVQEELIRIWQRTQKAVVFVTHDLTEALLLGQRVLMIRDGQIAADVQVPFTYPRTRDITLEPKFQELRRELTEYFE